MAVREKYQAVLELGEALNVRNGDVQIEGNQLKILGTANTQYEKKSDLG